MFLSSVKSIYSLGETGSRKETSNHSKKGCAGSTERTFTVKNYHFAFTYKNRKGVICRGNMVHDIGARQDLLVAVFCVVFVEPVQSHSVVGHSNISSRALLL